MTKPSFFPNWRFTRMVWMAPVAYACHFCEEYIGFPAWVTTHFSVTFSTVQFERNGVLFMVTLMGLSLLAHYLPGKTAGFLFLTYIFGLFLHNALFHVGATVILKTYSPGLATGVLLYVPLSLLLAFMALREPMVSRHRVLTAALVGGVVHYAVLFEQLTC